MLPRLRRLFSKSRAPQTLPAQAAYRLWAPTYGDYAHNPLMRAEEQAMLALLPTIHGKRVIDVACGTGRWGRIAYEMGAALVIGVDSNLPMLIHASLTTVTQADMSALPLPGISFDVALCGLAIGHLPQLDNFMREMARVTTRSGVLLLSHFHSEGHAAGWQREFTAPDGRRLAVEHHPHSMTEIERVCRNYGFGIEQVSEPRAGIEINERFPGSDQLYQRYHGLRALLIVRARKLNT